MFCVPPTLPFQLAGGRIDARQDRLVQPVDEAVVEHDPAKRFFIRLLRQTSRTEYPAPSGDDLEHRAPYVVAGRDEHAFVVDDERLRSIDVGVRPPRMEPEPLTAVRREC